MLLIIFYMLLVMISKIEQERQCLHIQMECLTVKQLVSRYLMAYQQWIIIIKMIPFCVQRYRSGKTTLGKLDFTTVWTFVPFFDLNCGGEDDFACRVKYGISAIDEVRGLYYLVLRNDYTGDRVVQIDINSGINSIAFESSSSRFEIGELDILYNGVVQESFLILVSRESDHFSTYSTYWNSITINTTSRLKIKNHILDERRLRRQYLLNFDAEASANIYMPAAITPMLDKTLLWETANGSHYMMLDQKNMNMLFLPTVELILLI